MKKKILIILSILFGVVIFLLLYLQIWNPSWNPFRPAPQIILARMALAMKNTDSFLVDGFIKTEENKKTRFHYRPRKGEPETQEGFEKTTKEARFNFAINKKVKKTSDFSFDLDTKGHQEKKYYWDEKVRISDSSQVTKFKKIGDVFFLFNPDLNKDVWIRFEQDQVGDLLIFLLTKGEDIGLEIKIPKAKQEELIKIVARKIATTKFYKIEKELPDGEINGEPVYRYLVSLDKEEIKEIIADILLETSEWLSDCISISSGSSYSRLSYKYRFFEPMRITEFNFELREAIDQLFAKMQGVAVEVWIGKKDNYLYRIRLKKQRDLVDYYEKRQYGTSREDILEADISVLADIQFSKFNELPAISYPSKYINLEEIIQ